MVFTEDTNSRVWLLDRALRDDHNADLFFSDGEFKSWYQRLLSTLVVASKEREIVFASATADGVGARFALVSDLAVLVAHVPDVSSDDLVSVQLAPVTSIQALSIAADMTNEPKGLDKAVWPGNLTVDTTFAGIGTVQFVGNTYDRDSADKIGDIVRLLDLLRSQLRV